MPLAPHSKASHCEAQQRRHPRLCQQAGRWRNIGKGRRLHAMLMTLNMTGLKYTHPHLYNYHKTFIYQSILRNPCISPYFLISCSVYTWFRILFTHMRVHGLVQTSRFEIRSSYQSFDLVSSLGYIVRLCICLLSCHVPLILRLIL